MCLVFSSLLSIVVASEGYAPSMRDLSPLSTHHRFSPKFPSLRETLAEIDFASLLYVFMSTHVEGVCAFGVGGLKDFKLCVCMSV